MARDHARLYLSIWDDPDFVVLSSPAKLVYLHLFSQRRLTWAGVHDLSPKRWARSHPDLGAEGVRAALAELDAARFVVVDHDTEELLVRSFIRRDELWKQPNVLRAAIREAFEVESPILRAALAAELLRLPVEVTGPAPAVAARELGTDVHEVPATVLAAMAERPRRTKSPADAPTLPLDTDDLAPKPSPDPVGEGSADPPRNPSADPSRGFRGEGSGEGETGVTRPTLAEERGSPAPAPPRTHPPTRERAHPREAHRSAEDDGKDRVGSVRRQRRVEAERLVTVHTPDQPRRVLDRLRVEVIGLLADGVEPPTIAAGLRLWAGKTLPVAFLPELVAERQRAAVLATTPEARKRAAASAEAIERLRADAIADDDRTPVGRAVRGELPAHAEPEALDALVRQALDATIPGLAGRVELVGVGS